LSTGATSNGSLIKDLKPMDNNAYKGPLFKRIIEEELAKLA
jgi:hypothetical protein